MLTIKDLRFSFPNGFNLCIDNLRVEGGRILAIIGPNGAGKTTLLNIIALFQKCCSGAIDIFGQNILATRDGLCLRRRISFVFSQPYLLNGTVFENISLPIRLRGKENNGCTDEILQLFKIHELKDRPAHNLSQGEMHRVSLARAMVTKPELILLDEPFLSLDPLYKRSLMAELRKIIKEAKTTALFVTQDLDEALHMADVIAVMKEGRILQKGLPEEIFTKPASKEVADFVGVETVVEGTIIEKKENLCIVKVGDRILEAVSECNVGDDVFFCLRPEDVTLAKELENNSARNHLGAKIVNIQPWRLEYRINLSCGFNVAASVTRQSLEELNLKVGDEVFVSFKATAAHLIKR